ncbi:CBS domain-containing protein [Candidatus Bathyarchaeota archaeon]|nr:MAG: CBS domain-containing protein [Candidatus Bathyarchaeota archaeon]
MSMSITAKDICSKEINSVKDTDTLSKCLEGFKKGMPPALAVLDEKGKYVGMITRRTILRSRLDFTMAKVRPLMQTAPQVSPDMPLGDLAKLMIGSGMRQLPLFDKGKLMGFVTDEDVIHAAVDDEWGRGAVEKVMTRAPHSIEAGRSVGAVFGLMREYGISHAPVMASGRLVGMVSIEDILENIYWPQHRQTTGDIVGEKIETLGIAVKGIMASPVITVDSKTSLRVAEKRMHDYDISCLCVVSGDRLVGILTKLDFLEPISQVVAQARKLTIQFGVKDIEIDESQQGFMMNEFDSFSHKYQEAFQLGTLFVYMKSHGDTTMRGTPMIHCRLQFRTARGTFFAASEGWGVEPTFRVALDRLERRLLRSKELLAYNPRFARDYMRKMGIPSEEE